MRALVFDAGSIISFTTNNLLWLLEPLKTRFGGEFYITKTVKDELVRKPFCTKKFKFEAIQVRQYVLNGTIKVIDTPKVNQKALEISELANNTFTCKAQPIRIVHKGEVESLAATVVTNAEALVIDERTTRHLIEAPQKVSRRLRKKLHARVHTNEEYLGILRKIIGGIKVVRSVELVAAAFELGLLDRYLHGSKEFSKKDRATLLESVLWGLKLNGCAVSSDEISEILKVVMEA